MLQSLFFLALIHVTALFLKNGLHAQRLNPASLPLSITQEKKEHIGKMTCFGSQLP
jgi:hypothetical protein